MNNAVFGFTIAALGAVFGWLMTILIDTQQDTRGLVDLGSDLSSANHALIEIHEKRLDRMESDIRELNRRCAP